MAWTKTSVIIEDQVRAREDPGGVKELIRATANTDTKRVAISLPQDPAQAGKSQAHDFAVWLRGWRVFFRRPSGDKITRFGPFSAYAKPTGDVKKVFIVRGPWNKAFLEELEAFPTPGVKDDQVDSTSDAFNTISDNLRQPKPTGKLEVINESDRS
jgi:predicted phage terminase large subunit-like protein